MIVGALLTQNTSWSNVQRAIERLKMKRILHFRKMARTSLLRLAWAIRPAGYFNVKARRLRNFTNFVNSEYGGNLDGLLGEELPLGRRKLLSINGVGPETADSILLYAAHKPVFVVDTYTKRIFTRLGLLEEGCDYEQTQRFCRRRLPRRVKLYNEFHALLVAHAKRVCLKTHPRCGECVLRPHCRYFLRNNS